MEAALEDMDNGYSKTRSVNKESLPGVRGRVFKQPLAGLVRADTCSSEAKDNLLATLIPLTDFNGKPGQAALHHTTCHKDVIQNALS